LIKGKEASKYDFINILPDFKEAIVQANKVLNELQKINLNANRKDGRKKDFKKRDKKYSNDRTFSFSFSFWSHTYKISMYWPKLMRLFLGEEHD